MDESKGADVVGEFVTRPINAKELIYENNLYILFILSVAAFMRANTLVPVFVVEFIIQ